MKIGVLIDRLNVGGVEKIAVEEVIALRRLGHDASLVVMREKAVVKDAFPDLLDGVPIDYLDRGLWPIARVSFQFPFFHFFSLFHITYPFLLPLTVRPRQYDYLISHGTYTSLTAVQLKRRRHIPFSAFIWDPAAYILERVYPGRIAGIILKTLIRIARGLDRYLITNMDSVLVGGQAHNELIRSYRDNVEITTIYPSVHPADTIKSKSDYVLIVTAWKEGKNPEYLAELLEAMPDLKIKMAGRWIDPNYRRQFEDFITKKQLTDSIKILGGVSEDELTDLYARARVLLQTNDDRGFGMPAMEAAAQGTTFVIPTGQGVGELFKQGVDGYFTKERDTESIVEYLSRLLRDEQAALKMGKSAWKKVKTNYSWESHATALVRVAAKYKL